MRTRRSASGCQSGGILRAYEARACLRRPTVHRRLRLGGAAAARHARAGPVPRRLAHRRREALGLRAAARPRESVPLIELNDVQAAAARLAGVAHRTPVFTSRTLDGLVGASVHLKAEGFQRGGAFKFRGAYNKIASLS